jgi:beta-1,4-mannosyltransferase
MRILAWPGVKEKGSNPYTHLLYTQVVTHGVQVYDFTPWLALLHRHDIFHIHWPEYYIAHRNSCKAIVGSLGLLFLVFWCRMRGTKVIWTVHNLGSHNKTHPRMEANFWNVLLRWLDGFVALTECGCAAARQRFPALGSLSAFVIPHGHYRGAYPNHLSRTEARHTLGVPDGAKVILFFGTIAPYKNVPQLVKVFRDLEDPEAILLVAGACVSQSEETNLRQEASHNPRLKLYLGCVPKDEVQCFFQACDLVVLPFLEVLNSGSALLALSFDRPILVPCLGALPELQSMVSPEWVRTYSGALSAFTLQDALTWLDVRSASGSAPLDSLDWGRIAEKTVGAYQSLLYAPDHRTGCHSDEVIRGPVDKHTGT